MSLRAESHPSFLALDQASLGIAVAEVQAHLATCEECRQHVESVSAPASSCVALVRSSTSGLKPSTLRQDFT